ncbi:MAG TPA: GNAT family N-acetyltransferase [Candidatus Rubrimentiphilum sp.]|nr:GNAT family N-acetyltransferase [Candidatus Rubrimentiphilum sp.]
MKISELVNLAVELDRRSAGAALSKKLAAIRRAGFGVELASPGDDQFLAWIDYEFGGTWSSEAFAGKNIIARKDGRFAGFATYDPRGLQYIWLRGLAKQEKVGIFGPFGVAAEFRGGPLGPLLLNGALCALRQEGFKQALIAAVGNDKLIAYYQEHSGAQIAERFDRSRWQQKKWRAVILASGEGTNFQSVIDGVAAGSLPLQLGALLCNDARAHALERARSAGIPAVSLPWDKSAQSRVDYDARLSQTVREWQPDIVLLLGWMHLLDERFVTEFPETLNIHPAFLPLSLTDEVVFPDGSRTPAFRGARAVRDALAWGSRWTGATVHRVTPQTDRGPVLARKPLLLNPGDTEQAIFERLHPLEHRTLATAIMRWVYERPKY